MKYGIVVDSSCDLKMLGPGYGRIDYTRVPLKLDVGDKEFADDENLDIDVFLDELYAYKGKTGSAAPSPADWLAAFEKSENVFVLTITSALSGSYASAQVAMRMFLDKYPDRKIYLLDTLSTGPEMILLARRVEELALLGESFETIRGNINEYHRHLHLFFALQSLENLIKNGRVNRIAGNIAGILGIKILGCASEHGTLEMMFKLRGKRNVYDKMVSEMAARGFKGGKAVITHCQNEETAEYVAAEIRTQYPDSDIDILPTGGLCSYYAERGGILLGFEGDVI